MRDKGRSITNDEPFAQKKSRGQQLRNILAKIYKKTKNDIAEVETSTITKKNLDESWKSNEEQHDRG